MKKKGEEVEKILDVDAAIQGTMVFKDPVNLRINGDFSGQLDTRGTLMIGPKASVKANITGDTITVAGTVEGDIVARELLSVVAPARVIGNVQTPALTVSQGATINGVVAMNGASAQSAECMMTVAEVAQYLEMQEYQVVDWAKAKKIPARFENSEWLFVKRDVDAWIQKERVNV